MKQKIFLNTDELINNIKNKDVSPRNLRYMQKFASTYKVDEFLQEILAKISCYHNIAMIII